MVTRIAKIVALGSFGIMVLLVAFNNVVDYNSNLDFVRHILLMDTIFENSSLKWRSIDSVFLHHTFYILIIIAEFMCAGLCLVSSFQLIKNIKNPNEFHTAKRLGIIGLTIGLLIWFLGFAAIGAEWFASWQSSSWSSTSSGRTLSLLILACLIFLTPRENTDDP